MQDLADHFNANKKPEWSGLQCHQGNVVGCWWLGRWYNTSRDATGNYFYGAYPKGFLPRVELLFGEQFALGVILHLCSGTLQGDGQRVITLDINPALQPNVVGNAEEVDKIWNKPTFDLILVDPPYENNHLKYGTKKISRKKVITVCSKIIKPGGYLAWLDTLIPQWSKTDWEYKGLIGVAQSTNHRMRGLLILRAKEN